MHWYTWQCASRLDGAVMYLDSVGSCAESESPQDTRNPAYIRNRPKSEGRSPANMAGITTCCCARCSCARVPSLACTLQVFFDKVCILHSTTIKSSSASQVPSSSLSSTGFHVRIYARCSCGAYARTSTRAVTLERYFRHDQGIVYSYEAESGLLYLSSESTFWGCSMVRDAVYW